MNQMEDLYKKVQGYLQFDRADPIIHTVFKSLILMGCGGYFGLILREINSTPAIYSISHGSILIIGLTIFVYMEYRRLKKEKLFPVTILEHLTAVEALRNLNEKYNRQIKIYEYIDNSIQSLNSNTCPVITSPDNFLCQQDLHQGLRNVLYDLVERPNYFFNIDKTKFTIGAFLKDVIDKESSNFISSIQKSFIFRDDLKISDYMPESFNQVDAQEEAAFQVQITIMEAFKFGKYLKKELVLNNTTFTLICSPIPNVCEECPPDGVIYAFYQGNECCSNDSESVLQIFGRILSNWISKYNECARREKLILLNKNKTDVVIPKEVLELLQNSGEKA